MTFKRGGNCKYFMELAKNLGLFLVGIGSIDLLEKNKNLVESLLWQHRIARINAVLWYVPHFCDKKSIRD